MNICTFFLTLSCVISQLTRDTQSAKIIAGSAQRRELIMDMSHTFAYHKERNMRRMRGLR